jgi:cyclohexa-1,5-dienecarbonyl-CoA hydratase
LRDHVAEIVLDRPPLNVLDLETLKQLNAAIQEACASSPRILLLTSRLARAFSAGVEIRDHAADRLEAMLGEVRENARVLLEAEAITIAAINGSTLGGGAELALLCDMVMAAEETSFRFPEVGLAAFPPIAAAILPDRFNSSTATPLLLGQALDAPALLRLGLASEILTTDQLLPTARRRAQEIAGHSAVALRALILATRKNRSAAILERLDEAIRIYKRLLGDSGDAKEGIEAFLQKRPPVWSDR